MAAPAASGPAALRVPVALEIGDQRRAEVAVGLLARIDREIGAEHVERLLGDAERAPVSGRAYDAGTGQPMHHSLDRRVHLAGLDDLITDQAALRAVAFDPALVLNRLARNPVAGEARQPHVRRAGNNALLARGQSQERSAFG